MTLAVIGVWLVTLAATLALVDFVSGLVHWAEDTFFVESTPVVGRWLVVPNVIHHENATAFVSNSWLASSWDLLAVGALVGVAAWHFDALAWPAWLFIVLGVNANQIHKWNHMPPARRPAAIRLLQRLHVLQSSSHHAAHHRGKKNTHYCVITPFVNPILDWTGFWRALEGITVPGLGAPRRVDLQRAVAD